MIDWALKRDRGESNVQLVLRGWEAKVEQPVPEPPAPVLVRSKERVIDRISVTLLAEHGAVKQNYGKQWPIVVRAHQRHPQWCADEIAQETGFHPGYIRAVARRKKLIMPSRFARRIASDFMLNPRSG